MASRTGPRARNRPSSSRAPPSPSSSPRDPTGQSRGSRNALSTSAYRLRIHSSDAGSKYGAPGGGEDRSSIVLSRRRQGRPVHRPILHHERHFLERENVRRRIPFH